MRPWKPPLVHPRHQPAQAFNGATAMRPWKPIRSTRSRAVASVVQWGHGHGAVETVCQPYAHLLCLPEFNGATAMRPWKPRGVGGGTGRAKKVQWGHGHEAVETILSC